MRYSGIQRSIAVQRIATATNEIGAAENHIVADTLLGALHSIYADWLTTSSPCVCSVWECLIFSKLGHRNESCVAFRVTVALL